MEDQVDTEKPGFITQMTSETLIDRVGERIVSRLHEMTHNLAIGADVPDYRLEGQVPSQ